MKFRIVLAVLATFMFGLVSCDKELQNTLEALAPLIKEYVDNQSLEDVADDVTPTPPVIVEPDPEPDPVIDPEPVVSKALKVHHYNPAAWKGLGSAVVLCEGVAAMDECKIEGKRMVQHGAMDKNRYLYTVYRTPGLGGTITCERGNKVFTYKVKSSGLQFGSCK